MRKTDLQKFFIRDDVTVVVTDSGLGGMSVVADLAERMKTAGLFRRVRIIFFNASFDNRSGYNKLDSEAAKLAIFDSALDRMTAMYHPDLIIIACNTLSVLYPKTLHYRHANVPVVGIVEIGVDLILGNLPANGTCNVVLFATPTTISSNVHKQMLASSGVSQKNIIGIACPDLADYIEEDFRGEGTQNAVAQFVDEAITALDPAKPVMVSLNCTHYGFIASTFREKFELRGIEPLAILDPNPGMTDLILSQSPGNRFEASDVSVDVICKVNIFPEVMASIGHLVSQISPQTAGALKRFRRDVHLF
ncbi:MAG: aspartate/glutamate racemase family protein [candidate division KSB1 bacterium]|jgi:glutamate racemase|nr:aspartate/glutamate racemase family protein [candidate division KSB1 bacterium]